MPHSLTVFFNTKNRLLHASVVNVSLALLAACGGGGGSVPSEANSTSSAVNVAASGSAVNVAALPDAVAPSATLSGSIVKGPVTGAQVCVYELTTHGKGKQLGCTLSNSDGSYSLTLAFLGEVVVEAVGGSYTDEATGLAGVLLFAPLTSVTQLGGGPNLVHATPLTALAYARALATGGLNLAEFQTKANSVRDTFGLAADVDLVRTLPTVATGSTNPYGAALFGVSKMLGMGATLAGVVGNTDLAALKTAYAQALLCTKAIQAPPKVAAAALLTRGEITILGGAIDFDGSIFTVSNPDPVWRASLSNSPTPMGCTVNTNTADLVVLNCPFAALQGNVSLVAGDASAIATSGSQATGGTLILGGGIQVQGDLAAGGNVSLVGSGGIQVQGSLTAGGNISVTANTLTGTGTVTSGGTLTTNTSPVTLSAGSLLACTANALAASGALLNQGAVTLATSGNVPSLIPGDPVVSLASSGLQTNSASVGKTLTAGTLVINGSNLASNYGGGITVTNTGTITNATISVSSSGQ